jgi:hypothetical protein
MISIVVPTVQGREEHLENFKASYAAHTEDYELIVVPNDGKPVGVGWQAGAEKALGDYIHLTNDDCGATEGWWQAARLWCDAGHIPCPRVINPNGTLQTCGDWDTETPDWTPTTFTRIPFVSREQLDKIGPMIPVHYYSDNWVSHRGNMFGYPTTVCRGYTITHDLGSPGRDESRMGLDGQQYQLYVEGALVP